LPEFAKGGDGRLRPTRKDRPSGQRVRWKLSRRPGYIVETTRLDPNPSSKRRAEFDTMRHFRLTVGMNERLETAVQLIALAAFVAAILIIVMTSLTSISAQCTRDTPFLPVIFPCFAAR
jgi:hypothetical protein